MNHLAATGQVEATTKLEQPLAVARMQRHGTRRGAATRMRFSWRRCHAADLELGIYLASAIYIAGFMVWLGKYSWWKSIALGLGTSVAVFMLFEVWFQVALFKGSLFNPLAAFGY